MVAAHRLLLVPSLILAVVVPAADYSHGPHSEPAGGGVLRVSAPEQPISHTGVGATVSAPPAHARPVWTQSGVVKLIAGDDFAQTVSGGSSPSTISLVMYENAFGVMHPGASDTPSVPRQLAWLVTSTGAPSRQLALGGPLSAGRETSAATRLFVRPLSVCTSYVAISASSGTDLDGFSMCNPVK